MYFFLKSPIFFIYFVFSKHFLKNVTPCDIFNNITFYIHERNWHHFGHSHSRIVYKKNYINTLGTPSINEEIKAMSSRLQNLFRQALNKYPTVTQGVQVSILMGGSDIIAQCAVEKAPVSEINWKRTGQFCCMGLFFVGPALKIWFGKLESMVNPNQKAWQRGLKKMSIDQLAFAPVFTGTFTSLLSVIQGLNPDQIVERLKKDYLNILKTNYILWPLAQMINFALIPLNFQVVFAQSIAVLWNTYLSMTLGGNKSEVVEVDAQINVS